MLIARLKQNSGTPGTDHVRNGGKPARFERWRRMEALRQNQKTETERKIAAPSMRSRLTCSRNGASRPSRRTRACEALRLFHHSHVEVASSRYFGRICIAGCTVLP
jgi:hypothetical protein